MTDQQGHDPIQPDEPSQPEAPVHPNTVQQPRPANAVPEPPQRRKRKTLIVSAATAAVLLLCCGAGISGLGGSNKADHVATQRVTPTPVATSSSPTGAPTTTAPAPTTAAPPPPAAPAAPSPAAPKPRVINGRGDDVLKIPPLTDLAVVVFKCPRCSSNTVLKSDGPDGLLVNEIGAYSGKRWINLEDNSLTTQFQVKANSKWTLTIGTVDQLATKAPTGKASGRGDDVVVLGGNASAARITHSKGESNFVVYAYSLETGEGGLLVNEIGGYSGTQPLSEPALVQVTADGNWTITPV